VNVLDVHTEALDDRTMIASTTTIQTLLTTGELSISPIGLDTIQPASIDLRLNEEVGRYSVLGELDTRQPSPPLTINTIPAHGIVIRPGDVLICRSTEWIKMPLTFSGQLQSRSTIARVFIEVLQGYIDPGYEGFIDIKLANIGRNSVRLYAEDRVAQLVLHKLTEPAQPYSGKYKNKSTLGHYIPDTKS
jgi:deoxycytidine triphosphate deaminase